MIDISSHRDRAQGRTCLAASDFDDEQQEAAGKLSGKIRDPERIPAYDEPLLQSGNCQLSSESRSFGGWLEPRYIFGAGRLI